MDLNSDLGEIEGPAGIALDDALLGLVSSANVACGGHAGDAASMRRICELAVERGVSVGAQVSYADRANFGRVRIDVPSAVLQQQVADQLGGLDALAHAAGTSVRYVKPHGALYHAAARDDDVAEAVVAAIGDYGVPVLSAPGSALARAARESGLGDHAEAFADRGYESDGTLVPRDRPGALVTDPAEVTARVDRLLREGVIESIDGIPVVVPAESICVHCDTPGAISLARAVREAILATGGAVEPFVEGR